jgi:hypothetical protein
MTDQYFSTMKAQKLYMDWMKKLRQGQKIKTDLPKD